jgi:mannose-6-phosphate isomerase-like protein (cupin superfamily)
VKLLAGGCRVYSPDDGEASTIGNWSARPVISRASGAKQITQTVNEYAAGSSPYITNPGAEEVLYIAAGEGSCDIDGFIYALCPGIGVFVPPGSVYSIYNQGPEPMRVISSCCPEDPQRRIVEEAPAAGSGDVPDLLVHEQERKEIRAGIDRRFRYIVHTDVGCKQITQFVGWIPPSKAPFHHHEYEEGIFILEGSGVVHTEEDECEFGPGSSIYFPQGARHCVENPGTSTIKLLGAFYPSGSPGAAYEDA